MDTLRSATPLPALLSLYLLFRFLSAIPIKARRAR